MTLLWEPTEDFQPGRADRCTPEKLLKFCKATLAINKRLPTLLECKHEFGGILGPMVDYWKLKEAGLL